jgi:hypothetical protein
VKVRRIVNLDFPEKETFTGRPDDTGIPDEQEKLPDLRLKNNNQRDEPDTDKLSEDLTQQLHLEGFNDLPDQVNGNDPYKDPDGGSPFYEVVDLIEQDRKEDDIDDIDDPDVKKAVDV